MAALLKRARGLSLNWKTRNAKKIALSERRSGEVDLKSISRRVMAKTVKIRAYLAK